MRPNTPLVRAIILILFLGLLAGCSAPAPETPLNTETPPPPAAEPDASATSLTTAVSSPTVLPYAEPEPIQPWQIWQAKDVKGLDSWGDSDSVEIDLIALYEKEHTDAIAFRLDLLDIQADSIPPVYIAIDLIDGGNTQVIPDGAPVFEIEWDLLVQVTGTSFSLLDVSFVEKPDWLLEPLRDRQIDLLSLKIDRAAFAEWDGDPFRIQAAALTAQDGELIDTTPVFRTDENSGRGKLILYSGNSMLVGSPSAKVWYDGFEFRSDLRRGERRGLRYILAAVDKYELPLMIPDLRIEVLPTNEYLGINDRLRDLSARGLLELMTTLDYGHFMNWQPDDVDARTIAMAQGIHAQMNIPASRVFYPYEAMLTPGDIEVIKSAGYDAIFGSGQYRYWFGWDHSLETINIQRKLHQINGIKFVFDPRIANYQGFYLDERWGEIDWSTYTEEEAFLGTDRGLDLWWRRILHDLAMDPDQEQFFTIGTDMQYTQWFFDDVVEDNFLWIASHPWIEATTYSDILNRGWGLVDHGTLDLADDELLIRYKYQNDGHYNAYFPQHYYGGIADGHSPLIPAGTQIEAYYDYIPYLRDGVLIPSGRIMGDDQTPGSILYETLANLRSAPDNRLAELAWLSYLMNTGEQTYHEGAALHPDIKVIANFVSQANKLAYAARWAEQAAGGDLNGQAQVLQQDLDLDGEIEYILQNDRVLGIFENDGGRLEYAFAYDANFGPIQLVSPGSQYTFEGGSGNYLDGEVSRLMRRPQNVDAAFVDDLNGDGDYEYDVYAASLANDSITFTSPDGALTKTYTLEEDILRANYQVHAGQAAGVGFGLTPDPLAVFRKDWDLDFAAAQAGSATGWQMATGGVALVNPGDAIIQNTFSFQSVQSLCFPCGVILLDQVGGSQKEGIVSLILRSAPVAATSKPTPLPTREPGSTPSQLVIYDDELASGWKAVGSKAKVDIKSTKVVSQGDFAIETDSTAAWGALMLSNSQAVDTSNYRQLVFKINPRDIANLNLSVTIFNKGKNLTYVYINDYLEDPPLQPETWVEVVIPLNDLNPVGQTFDMFYFESELAGQFYIDDVRLIGN